MFFWVCCFYIEFIQGSANAHACGVHIKDTLDFNSENNNDVDDVDFDVDVLSEEPSVNTNQPGSLSSTGTTINVNVSDKRYVDIRYKKRAVDYWRNEGGKKQRTFKCVQHIFKQLRQASELYVWEKQVLDEGTRYDKIKFVAREVLSSFKAARLNKKSVHDSNLIRWALDAAKKVSFSTFRASKSWVYYFKKSAGIVSRKITKFITKRQMIDEQVIRERGLQFVDEARQHIEQVGADRVYNTDQSGFNLEFHAGRTLNNQGEKTILAEAQSLNSLTHSYTIQPIISADGRLLPTLLVVLQETNGEFGIRVKETMFKSTNLHVLCSKSGKLSKDLVQDWIKNVYLPNVQDESTLILDSWGGQSENCLSASLPDGTHVNVLIIPKCTTGFVQPLDVYGFRVWKSFVRYFYDLIILHNFDVNIHLRDNILRIQAFTHNQFSSPRYTNLWKYSWFKCGYLSERPPCFENPLSFVFRNADMSDTCAMCDDVPLVKCSWCSDCMCLQHFFYEIHVCDNYVE